MLTLTSRVRPRARFSVTGNIALCFALACQIAGAATYYVSPSGSDSNPGTSTAPFRNVSRGVSAAQAGDTIILEDGTYGNEGKISDASGGWNGYAAPLDIYKAGNSSAWITLKARNKGKAVLDCGTTTTVMGCDKYVHLGVGAAYWSFEDLVFTRGAFGGIGTDDGASHIRVKGCRFENIGYWNDPTTVGEDGIGFNKTATDWWIEGNVFHDIGRTGTAILDHGIYAAGTNVTVINNVFYNITDGWAIQMADGASNWLIANNTFAFPHTSQSGHIMMWNTNNNITIRNNIFYNPGSSYAISRYTSTVNGCYVDHNLITNSAAVMSSTSGCTLSSNAMSGDPKFTNVSAYDFHVQTGGAGVDQGIAATATDFDGLARPQGAALDLGAYELGSGIVAPPVISAVLASAIGTNSAVVSWNTDKPATTYVDFGPGSFSSTTPLNATLITAHTVSLSGLSPNTVYVFRVGSTDANGNLTVSGTYSFTTLSATVSVPSTPTPTPSASGDTTTGIRSLWDFTELTGTSTADSSGNGNTGTLSNVSWRSDVCSGCVAFNGTSSYVSVAESTSLEPTTDLTVSMWVAPGSAKTTDPRLIAKLYSWDVKLNNGYAQFSGAGKYAIASTKLATNTWQHLVITFTSGTVKFYLNGALVGARENTFVGGETIAVQPYGMYLGTDSSRSNFFAGIMDDVRVYGRALSATDIATLYSNTKHTAAILRAQR